MTKPSIASVALYVHGQNLDPEMITRHLDFPPTSRHQKGDVLSAGAVAAKGGMWRHKIDVNDGDVTSALRALAGALSKAKGALEDFPGVEEAYVDIFVVPSGSSDLEFTMPDDVIALIAKHGVPVNLTIAAIPQMPNLDSSQF